MYGCESSTLFAIKAMMREIPFKFNIIVMVLSLILFGQALRVCEAPISRVTQNMDHFSLENSIWAVILTMTTGILFLIFSIVGYGDFYPRTLMGRIVIFFCSLFGVVIVSMVVVSVMNLFEMNNLESKAYTVIKKLRIKNRMKNTAAGIIGKITKLHLNLKKEIISR